MPLVVRVDSAWGIPPMDRNGLADPYVILFLDDTPSRKRQQTKTVEKTLEPEWNEDFTFDVSGRSSTQTLHILLRDRDFFVDEDIATAHIQMHSLLWDHVHERGSLTQTYDLTPAKSVKATGQITIKLTFFPAGGTKGPPATRTKSSRAIKKTVFAPNEDIVVTYTGGLGLPKDWIGIYREGQRPGADGPSTTGSAVPGTSGTHTFSYPFAANTKW